MNTPQINQGWWTTAKAGDKVVCINSGSYGDGPWVAGEELKEGGHYTIKSIHIHDGDLVLWLIEVSRAKIAEVIHGPLAGYCVHRFRPLVSKSTDKAMKAIRQHLKTRELAE